MPTRFIDHLEMLYKTDRTMFWLVIWLLTMAVFGAGYFVGIFHSWKMLGVLW